jgi:pimeloyl-ACP methyl ester carboxylesterase
MAEAAVNGVRLHYELEGSGDAVVFVHGSLLDLHDWDVVAARLAHSFQVLSYDRRGHSQSSGSGTLDDDLGDVAATCVAHPGSAKPALPCEHPRSRASGSAARRTVSRRVRDTCRRSPIQTCTRKNSVPSSHQSAVGEHS